MKLPTLDDLNRVSQLMHDMDFMPLPHEFKTGVVVIAQQGVLAGVIKDLPTDLSIQFAECLVEYGPKMEGLLNAIGEVSNTLEPIAEWFEKSRLYEP